jgi:hypothetical protein
MLRRNGLGGSRALAVADRATIGRDGRIRTGDLGDPNAAR